MQLTIEKRESIRATLIERGMAAAKLTLIETKTKAAMQAYNDLYPPGTQARRMLDDATGKEWFVETREIHISDIEKPYRGEMTECTLDKARAFLACHVARWEAPIIVVTKKAYKALLAEIAAYTERETKLREKVTQVLWGCRTWKQLYEVWPDGVKVFSKFRPTVIDKPLVVRVPKSLNNELGLP